MVRLPLAERTALAEVLARSRRSVAETVTNELRARHPGTRFGERAQSLGLEDAGLHLDYLSAAIEAGSTAAFEEHARWIARVLGSRGIGLTSVAESFELMEKALARLLDPAAREVVALFVASGKEAALAASAPPLPWKAGTTELRRALLQALLLGQRQAATTLVMDALRDGFAARELSISVFQEILYEIGRLWETNQISLAQEQIATTIVEYLLTVLYDRMDRAPRTRRRAVVTGISGEFHGVGARIVADALEADGWDVRYLGTNVPDRAVLAALREHKACALGISATMLVSIPRVRQLVNAVSTELEGERPRLILGGAAFRLAPELPGELGAAVAHDIPSALQAFRAPASASS